MGTAAEKALHKGLGKAGSKGKAHVHAVHVRRASGGGFIASHEMQNEAGDPMGSQEHVIPDAAGLQDHMQSAMGDQPPAGAGSPAPTQGAPEADPGAGGGM